MLWWTLCRIDQRVRDFFNTRACRNRDAVLQVRSQLLQILGSEFMEHQEDALLGKSVKLCLGPFSPKETLAYYNYAEN